MLKKLCSCLLLVLLVVALPLTGSPSEMPLTFGVVTQRSIVMTAQYWNPVLNYLEKKTGIQLVLKIERTAPEHSRKVGQGSYDLIYSNHFFTKTNAKAGYRVLARPAGPPITGAIVVLEGSPVTRLEELAGHEVGFPSPAAFVGYAVTMDALARQGIHVKPVFAGNQEGIMAQLKARRVIAASVNSLVMREYAAREQLRYRVLWQSPDYLNIPIAVHPRVATKQATALQEALVGMAQNAEGRQILEQGGALIGQPPPYGFIQAANKDYQNQWDFFKHALLTEQNK